MTISCPLQSNSIHEDKKKKITPITHDALHDDAFCANSCFIV